MIADIIAQDAKGRDVLIVEVQTRRMSPEIVSQYLEMMETASPSVPFAMVLDLEDIHVIRMGQADLARASCHLKTAEVLRHYDPEFSTKRIYPHYLKTLVEAWLHDLAYHWKMEVPPGSDDLAAFGLLPLLEGGTTVSEVPLGADSLR